MKLDDENWHVLTVSRRDRDTGQYTMEKAPCYHLVGLDEEVSKDKPTKKTKDKPTKKTKVVKEAA
jgi:hypothetical protein